MPRPLSEAEKARIRRWWAAMVPDGEIARRLGRATGVVCRWRKRLGLPGWYGPRYGRPHAASTRGKLRANARRMLEAAGVKSLCQLCPGDRAGAGGCRQAGALAVWRRL